MDSAVQMVVAISVMCGMVWLAAKSMLFYWLMELCAVLLVMLSGFLLGLGGAVFVHIPRQSYGMASICVLAGIALSWPCVMICWWRFMQLVREARPLFLRESTI